MCREKHHAADVEVIEVKGAKTHKKGSATVEICIVMSVYLGIIIMCFQSFFLLLTRAESYKVELQQETECTIEDTITNLRRWKLVE